MVPTKINKTFNNQFSGKIKKHNLKRLLNFMSLNLQSINQSKPQVHEKTMIINLLISYKYIEYQKLCHHPYRNSEYELLKLKFNSTSNQKLRNHLTF
jgi:hypothetical protein